MGGRQWAACGLAEWLPERQELSGSYISVLCVLDHNLNLHKHILVSPFDEKAPLYHFKTESMLNTMYNAIKLKTCAVAFKTYTCRGGVCKYVYLYFVQ